MTELFTHSQVSDPSAVVPGADVTEVQPPAGVEQDRLLHRPSAPSRARSLDSLGLPVALAVMAAGLLIIGLGWLGASGNGAKVNGQTVLVGQLPYLLSGGFLGLGVIGIGVGLFVAQSNRRDRMQLEVSLLAELRRGATPSRASLTDLDPTGELPSLVVATAASYHRATCRFVDTHVQELLTVGEAVGRGLRPCRSCRPAAGDGVS